MLILLALPAILSVILQMDYSDYLQRPTKSKPDFNLTSIVNGSYTKEFEDYLQDKFVLKPEFLSIKAYTNYALGLREFDNIIVKPSVLFQKPLKNPRAEIFANENYANLFSIPYKIIYEKKLPAAVNLKSVRQEVLKHHVLFFSNTQSLFNADDYYRGDHHLNEKGVLKMLEALNLNAEYKFTEAHDFRGGLSRKTGIIVKDKFKGIYLEEFKDLKANADGKEINVYNFDKLNSADPYLFYIGGNYGVVDIEGVGNGNVTIIKDSFANPTLPFFAKKYKNVRAIDARFLKDKIENNLLDGDVYIIGGF